MTPEPSSKQTLLLWVLLFTGEEPAISKARPALDKAERARMVAAGLIREEKRGRSTHVVLTDKAWDWAAGHLDAPLSRSKFSADALAGLLKRLKTFLEVRDTALVEILHPRPARRESAPPPTPSPAAGPISPAPGKSLEAAIDRAYFLASGSQWNVWVRLADLRSILPGVSRADLDRELLRLERAKKAVLYPLDDPQAIRPEDAAAALDVAGFKRHIVMIRG